MFATMHSSKTHPAANLPGRGHMTDLKSAAALRADRQMRRERWMAIGVLVLFGALLATLMFLAIMFGGPAGAGNTGYEFWMMP